MNKLIGLSIILALCGATTAQAAPAATDEPALRRIASASAQDQDATVQQVSSTQIKIWNAAAGNSTDAGLSDAGATSVSPGMGNSNSVLSTQAMTAPTAQGVSPAAATFESATPDVTAGAVTDFDATVPSFVDDFSEYDFSDAGNHGASAPGADRVLVNEPGMLLLWLAGLMALFARRR